MGFELDTNRTAAVWPGIGEGAVRTSRAMFQRVLSTWTMDLVRLRSLGLDQPGPRADRTGGPVGPPMNRSEVRRAA
ncbi:MAG TPA: hypothetical protein ENJ00_07300 [Phycisphaerales bacterium]|nr:hypothetical protein [Phycisphaerales bacterium]